MSSQGGRGAGGTENEFTGDRDAGGTENEFTGGSGCRWH